ncbi:hypothetical protein GC098_26190 [Paenibacillus sp. LMG 31458]|uniref:DUF3953 domain-containing protein n=1 Tax=Paenibacillus phytorum TaxID=2654977 RepID=A0ABX1Y2M4_9BACL|nr:hypothetical protein [Paenibacillus phytorum]NOU74834.1 hypothetical protein [Paenibacillus phytorum]
MFTNPYKNRNRVLLGLELLISIFTIIFVIVSSTGGRELSFSWFFLLTALIFLVRLVDTKDKSNIITLTIYVLGALFIIFKK